MPTPSFIADSIGQLASLGVEIANQWNLAIGTTASGTDYGLVAVDTGERFPQFEALAAWGRAGDVLLPVDLGELHRSISIYPTRRPDGSVVVTLLHPADETREVLIAFGGLSERTSVESASWSAPSPDTREFVVHGPTPGVLNDGVVSTLLRPWSITQLHLTEPR